MEEKKYLKWYNKVGYGSGDIAGNVVYAFLSAFVMIYLTDTLGLSAGIIGTLIMVSKFFDGFSDIIFGRLMDRTHTKMGKARPWMFWAFFGCAAMVIAIYAIPTSLGKTAQYAWFFIAYTLLNAVFYTANNIAYAALTALITKNRSERVQMGSIRFMFAFGTSLTIQTITVGMVQMMGGGADAWRNVAIIYAIVGILSNSLAVFSVRELSPTELAEGDAQAAKDDDDVTFLEALKLLGNRYYVIIVVCFILMQFFTATLNMGIYFMTYILGDANLLGVFAWAINNRAVGDSTGGSQDWADAARDHRGIRGGSTGAPRGYHRRRDGVDSPDAVLLRSGVPGYEPPAGDVERPDCRD